MAGVGPGLQQTDRECQIYTMCKIFFSLDYLGAGTNPPLRPLPRGEDLFPSDGGVIPKGCSIGVLWTYGRGGFGFAAN